MLLANSVVECSVHHDMDQDTAAACGKCADNSLLP